MTVFAHVLNGAVYESLLTLPAGVLIRDCFSPDLVWVDVTALDPKPAEGWFATHGPGGWTFTAPPAPPAPALAQRAAAAAGAGLTITLTGSVTLAATMFPTDPTTQSKLGAVAIVINTTGGFPDGSSTYPMKDASGAWHTFTVAQYEIVAGAIAAYVAALDLIADGNPLSAVALPAASVALTCP